VSFFPLTQAEALADAALSTLKALNKAQTTLLAGGTPKPGKQVRIVAPITELVYADLRRRSAAQNTTVGRLSADLLALATGHPGLIQHRDPVNVLRLAGQKSFVAADEVVTEMDWQFIG
jgi:hypothetical protein